MNVCVVANDEAARLAALRRLELLDSASEAGIDDYARLAASVTGAEISLISLVDAERQWFKSVHGLEGVTETPRAISFCSHAVAAGSVLQVADARNDPRFANNPLVLGEPRIRHYTGVPLVSIDGFAVGTLCVIDRSPRSLSPEQLQALRALAELLSQRLEARAKKRQLQRKLDAERRAAVAAYRAMPALNCTLAQDGTIVEASDRWLEHLGWQRHELIGSPLWSLLPTATEHKTLQAVLAGGRHEGVSLRVVSRSKGEREMLLSAARCVDCCAERAQSGPSACRDCGQFIKTDSILCAFEDITERVRLERSLLEAYERSRVTLECIGDGVLTIDALGQVQYLNPVAEQLTGRLLAEVQGLPIAEVLHVVDEQSGRRVECPLMRCLDTGELATLPEHSVLLRADGERLLIEDSAAPIRDGEGQTMGAVLVFRDATQQKLLQREISHRASHDPLTGLTNRAAFEFALAQALAEIDAGEAGHVLCAFDLDRFKVVNDSCGHGAGDELLRQLAQQMRLVVRQSDVLARIGGDEFALLLHRCSLDQARRTTEALRAAIEAFRFHWGAQVYQVGVSVGVVPINAPGIKVSEALRAADSACYAAKDAGRGRVQVETDLRLAIDRGVNRVVWASEIGRALDEDRLLLFAQGIHRKGNGPAGPAGCEILVRMRLPDGSLISPGTFLPAAERYHLATAIDRRVVSKTLEWLSGVRSVIPQAFFVNINLSGHSLADREFQSFLIDRVARSGVTPEQLCFEVTESAAVANLSQAADFMRRLRAEGCRFALDDFGRGMASFSYLKTLPLDMVKIDGGFVRSCHQDSVDRAMVDCVSRIAGLLGLETVAEFVESDSVRRCVEGLGVEYLQGYAFDRPLPVESLAFARAA